MLRFSTTVTTQRVGELDLSSLTEQTNPVTGKSFMVKVVFSFRYWAYRQRRANLGSVVSNICMTSPMVAVRDTAPRRSAGYQRTVNQ
jgi:hypothetical protein